MADEARYVDTLRTEYGASRHPSHEHACILEERPFYAPQYSDDHISILSFNSTPRSNCLIEALVDHPGLFPDHILVRWAQHRVPDAALKCYAGLDDAPYDREGAPNDRDLSDIWLEQKDSRQFDPK